MPTTSITLSETPLVGTVLRRADDALVLGHRLSEWCGHAPMLEEDIALANVALDRQFLYAAFVDPYWRAMTASTDPRLAEIAAKAEKESAYHLRHAAEWLIRLGDGTEESHARAVDDPAAPEIYTGELFEVDAMERAVVETGAAVDPASLRATWDATIDAVLGEATLTRPAGLGVQTGGRSGRHTEHLGHLLAEMQSLPRTYPGATW